MNTNNTTNFGFLRNFTPNSTVRVKRESLFSGIHAFEHMINMHYHIRGD